MEEEDWDLHAVVRGCTTTSSSSTTTASSLSTSSSYQQPSSSSSCSFFSILPPQQTTQLLSLSNSNPFETRNSIEELHELCKPFFLKSHSHPPSLLTSSNNSISYSSAPQKSSQLSQKLQQPQQPGSATTPRSKRRKNQFKKVCQVEAENLSSDIWAWRKYGQKPIKGSPYPRGYYRCSSSKGCLARKQVERNKTDPTMFIVTYTGEHSHPAPTHRNSLAGSTRQKPLTTQTVTNEDTSKSLAKTASPTTSEAGEEEVAPKSESKEDIEDLLYDDDEENEFGLSDMVVTDDFFEGLDELTTGFDPSTDDCFADPFSASVVLPAYGGNDVATKIFKSVGPSLL